jgi:protein gp37
MAETKIPWAQEALNFLTWNCNKVSAGCKHCYAQTHSLKYPQNSRGAEFLGAPAIREKAFDELRLIKPGNTVFVNTHSDTFHNSLTLEQIQRMFIHMNQRPDLIFLLLTKRPEIAFKHSAALNWTDNICLGTSVEDMRVYGRIETLANVPAKHRFLSLEPLLGAVTLAPSDAPWLDWVITGGESGEYRRPLGKQWAVDIQQYCARFNIPFYFKQGSSVFPDQDRLLNGREYNEFPSAFAALQDRFAVNVQQASLF